MKKRVLYLDVLRIVACFGVIANHTNFILKQAESAADSMNRATLLTGVIFMVLCKTAVTLFVMISGALLLKMQDDYKKNFKRIFRVAAVLLVFSAGYYLMGNYEHSPAGFIKTVTKTNVTTAFWYLYLYLGILVMLPVLQKMVAGFKKADYFYFLFFSLAVCSFSFVTDYNAHFSLPVFATFVGVFILGYFLDSKVETDKYSKNIMTGLMVIVCLTVTAFLTAYTYRGVLLEKPDAYRLIVYDNIFYTALSACIFMLAKLWLGDGSDTKRTRCVCEIGACTFGIYLFSDAVIKILMPYFEKMAAACGMSVLFMVLLDASVFICGLAVTWILRRIKYINQFL